MNANPKSSRRGLSLLEVLVSAAITSVGIFGVLALVPVATVQVGKGITEDRKAVLGKNAASMFHINGMRRPENWLFVDPNTGNPSAAFNANAVQAFCIDPRFVATYNSVVFPYPAASTPGIVSMPRLNLRSIQGSGGPMNAQLADEIFQAQDDLNFVVVGAPLYGMGNGGVLMQQFSSNGAGLTQQKRESAGRYSWLAMVVPKHGTINDEYVLSVVLFAGRDPSMQMNDVSMIATPQQAAGVNERVLQVAGFTSGGTGGGEVQLRASTSRNELEGIHQGTWVLLAGQTSFLAPNPQIADFKWYRVLATDDIVPLPPGAGPWTRNLTLQGADWQRPEWTGGVTPTQATIVSGVVGVFEKTIKLETTSLWTQ